MFWRTSIRLRRFARKTMAEGGSPQRIARGLAAGCLAAAFPLPGLQIALSFFFAWVVRGNKTVAVIPQFISNAATMLPMAWVQYWIGARLWPGAADITIAMDGLRHSVREWEWLHPITSISDVLGALGELGGNVIGPLFLGVAITGIAAALVAYPVGLIALSTYQASRARSRAMRGIAQRRTPLPLMLPIAPAEELAQTDSQLLNRFAIHSSTFVQAAGVELLVDGRQAFPAMLQAIASARQSVMLETYILTADGTGWRFAAALSQAALRGVRTRLLFDGVGAYGLPREYVDYLLQAGVEVAVYRPLYLFWRGYALGRLNRRDHRKILIVDGKVAFTGGLNIADEYAAVEDGGSGWRDTHVGVTGDVPVRALSALCEATWANAERYKFSGKKVAQFVPPPVAVHPLLLERRPPAHVSAPALLQVLSNKEFLQRVRVRRAYIHAIHNARRYILIENAYFIPDRGIRRALYRAVRRGVIVAAAVAKYSDVRIAAMASRSLYSELLANGVHLYEYPLSMLHCKVAVVDDTWSMVSSYNLDHRSLFHNLEAGVLILDRPFACALRDQILSDIAQCQPVSKQFHEARPWDQMLMESMAYQVRYWL